MRDTIFISHATPEDNSFTIWLASRLQAMGYKVWIDKNGLIGGEKFWEEIDQVIRNKAVKVLLVYSENICQKDEEGNIIAGRLKDGIYKEISLAESIAKQNQIKDFIVLANVDNAPYNLFIGADRLNQIPFYDNWADGLKLLHKKIQKDEIPLDENISNENFINWFQYEYVTPNPIISKKELFYSNIWPIHNLPKAFFIHQFKTEQNAENFYKQHKKFPISKISNAVCSFEGDLLFHDWLGEMPEKVHQVLIQDIFLGYEREKFPTHADSVTHLKFLLKRVFHRLLKDRGMFWTEMSNKRLAYYHTPASLSKLKTKFQYPFRKDKKAKNKNLLGVYKTKSKWHYAVSVRPVITPILGYSLKSHLIFTDDGFHVWEDHDKIHSCRRDKGKLLFNEEWRDMFLGFLNSLKKQDVISVQLCTDFVLSLDSYPEMFWSQFGYYDPKDPNRQGLLSVYEDVEDEYQEEEDL